MTLVDVLLAAASLPALAASAYLAGLAVLARRTAPPAAAVPTLKYDVIVPAHNEEAEIAETVRSLRAVDYPASLFRVLVVADNCTDATAERAAAAGAQVLVRKNAEHRGK
jgi:1,2-diacylglycerol 3-beta-glucosyltransferase